jgi:hypothetical protein
VTSTRRPLVIVLLSCPWCDADIALDDVAMQGDVRCDECATAFSFAPDPLVDAREREAA